MIFEEPNCNKCSGERGKHVNPDTLTAHIRVTSFIINSYLVDTLCKSQCRVQASSSSKREIVAKPENVGEGKCFQEEVASFGIFILALSQGQIKKSEKASL